MLREKRTRLREMDEPPGLIHLQGDHYHSYRYYFFFFFISVTPPEVPLERVVNMSWEPSVRHGSNQALSTQTE